MPRLMDQEKPGCPCCGEVPRTVNDTNRAMVAAFIGGIYIGQTKPIDPLASLCDGHKAQAQDAIRFSNEIAMRRRGQG